MTRLAVWWNESRILLKKFASKYQKNLYKQNESFLWKRTQIDQFDIKLKWIFHHIYNEIDNKNKYQVFY